MRNYKTKKSVILTKIEQISDSLGVEKLSIIDKKLELLKDLKRANSAKYDKLYGRVDAIYREEALYVYQDKRYGEDKGNTILLDFYTHQEEQRRAKELYHRFKTFCSYQDIRADMSFNAKILFEPDKMYNDMLEDMSVIEVQGRVYQKQIDELLNIKEAERKERKWGREGLTFK